MMRLYDWEECLDFDLRTTKQLYGRYVNPGQVDLLASFRSGRDQIVKAEGLVLETAAGREILDFTGGNGVLNHGHNHPRILAARIRYQERKLPEVHKSFLSPFLAALSHNIAQLLPDPLEKTYLCNSGAEAVEGAVKLAYKAHGGTRRHILHSDISYHGKTLGAGGLTASPEQSFDFPTIPDRLRYRWNDLASVRELVERHSEDVYALLVEPFSASSLLACSDEFLLGVRQLCDEHDVALIFDEVYTGWAKTGELFFGPGRGVIPDVLTYSKSFGGGKSSISGYTARTPLFDRAYGDLADALLHSTTYNGFGEECVTAIEALKILADDDYVGRAQHLGERLRAGLETLHDKYPRFVRQVRGHGALQGLVLDDSVNAVVQKAVGFLPGKVFADPAFFAKLITCSLLDHLYHQHGILTFFGSNRGVPLILSPALVATDAQVDTVLEALDQSLGLGKIPLVLRFVRTRLSR